MNRPALALVAALFAGTTLTTGAEAGIRLGFGMPLGSFVASPFSPGARSCNKNSVSRMYAERDAMAAAKRARAAKIAGARQQAAAKQQAVARQQAVAAARREAAQRTAAAETRASKAQVASAAKNEANEAPAETTVASNKRLTEAAPTIFVPEAPATVAAATTDADQLTEIASVDVIDDAIKIKAPTSTPIAPVAKVEKKVSVAENTVTKSVAKTSGKGEEVCRRFSALVGALVDVPCE